MPSLKEEDPIGNRILEVAVAQIVRNGLAGVTTADVAAAAKTSKRELYDRYSSKEALFEGVIGYICRLGESDDPPRPDESSDLESKLNFFCFAAARRFALAETLAVISSASQIRSTYRTLLDNFWRLGPGRATSAIADCLRSAHKEGSIYVSQPGRQAKWLVMQCCGPFVLEMFFDYGKVPSNARIAKHVEDVVAAYIHGVGQKA